MMKIEIVDPINNQILYSYDLDDFKGGVYVRFMITGHVKVNFINKLSELNASLSGVFFD